MTHLNNLLLFIDQIIQMQNIYFKAVLCSWLSDLRCKHIFALDNNRGWGDSPKVSGDVSETTVFMKHSSGDMFCFYDF